MVVVVGGREDDEERESGWAQLQTLELVASSITLWFVLVQAVMLCNGQ